MRATRRLDILAIIGGLLAVILISGGVMYILTSYHELSGSGYDKARSRILAHMPDSDVRADFAILTSDDTYTCPEAYRHREQTVKEAARKFASSARIQFRAGTVMEGSQSAKALKRASELDTTNAYPLYLLASKAASRQSMDEAVSLLRKANQRKRFTAYPLPNMDYGVGASPVSAMVLEMLFIPIGADYGGYANLRSLDRALCTQAMSLHKAGTTDEALRLLGDVKQMAQAQLHREAAQISDISMGVALLKMSLSTEQKILKATGSQSKQAQQEMQNARYLNAGVRVYIDDMMPRLTRYLQRFFAPPMALASLALQVWFSLVVLAIFAFLARKSKGHPSSQAHIEATEIVFTIAGLIKLYALVFLPLGIISSLAYIFVMTMDNECVGMIVPAIAIIAPSILLHWRSARVYKKAYIDTGSALVTKPWKNAPTAEKREVARRLAGIHGGAVVFLVIWGLLISSGMKVSMGAFPWEFSSINHNAEQYEKSYVQDLLAGKIKISEKTIRESNPPPKRSATKANTEPIERKN